MHCAYQRLQKMSSMEGIYFDELSKIRVLQPEVLTQTEELKDECKQFVDSKFVNKFLLLN